MADHRIDSLPKLTRIGLWAAAPPAAVCMLLLMMGTGSMAFGSGDLGTALLAPAVFFMILTLPGFALFLFGLTR